MDTEPEKKIVIDGDRVIAFINAIKQLGAILEQLNVIEVKEAFIRGRNLGAIERILETQQTWQEAVRGILKELENSVTLIEGNRMTLVTVLSSFKTAQAILVSDGVKQAIANAKELATLLDRIEHHQQVGTFKLLATLTNK